MAKKRFGIDIDGTVTSPQSLLPFINKAFHLNLKYEDLTKYEITDVIDVQPEKFNKWFLQSEPLIYEKSPIAEGAKEVLTDWAKAFELYFISARATRLLDVTKKWFSKQQLQYHHIELIGTHHKVETAKKYNVDVFLEDKHDNAVAIAEELNIPVLLFDTPYNRETVPENVVRVKNWQEANKWIREWATASANAGI
ncbi:5' nucleotidase, NT5C type [Heyndrickxia acidiproducens]|uniref:5' nucleotidase, NT5C type n=1 Tax=Heyndrickxia acidiproducens TaxID=1121084 RepID=UPI00037DD2B8|nr:hypothetical protein [Heyndrickxia acidiproducens]